MSKLLKKIGRVIFRLFEGIFKIIDKIIIMPISRLVYNINKAFTGNNKFNKLLNTPKFLIILSLVFAVICFLLIDNKVINLVENEAEVIKNVPVNVLYNAEAYVVENVPDTVDIIITGRKSDIYLAKQLGDFSVELDLSKYTKAGTYKARFKCSEAVGSVKYEINPSYLSVTIKDRVSEVFSVNYDIVGTDDLNEKLSVGSVSLDKGEVVVKGSVDTLNEISSVKALVSVGEKEYTNAETYELTNIPVVAYNKKGEIVGNVEVVPNVLTGTLVLKSYKATVPLTVTTTGNLVSGKAIASITINGSSGFSLDVYGEEEDIKKLSSVPVPINVDGLGADNVKNYKVTISKPNGVRYMSTRNVTITATFGDETQKTVEVSDIVTRNLADGYSAVILSGNASVQVKGVQSNINNVDASTIKPYVDLTNLTEGTHEVEVKIDNDNPLIKYVVNNTITIKITKG